MPEVKEEQKIDRYVGIDLGKRTYELKLFNRDDTTEGWNGVTTLEGRLKLYARLRKTDRVGIEVCALAMKMAKEMEERVGCDVVVLNAGKLAVIYASMKKTDKEDALKIARLIRRIPKKELPTVELPTEEEWQMRKMISERRQMKSGRTREINMLHALFVNCGITDVVKKDLSTMEKRRETMKRLFGYDAETGARIAARLEMLEAQIEEMDKKIEAEAAKNKDVELLKTIPGVGTATAMAFCAWVGKGDRFSNRDEVANFVGLVPRLDISCSIVRVGGITRRGNSLLRSLLVMAAWSLVRTKNGGALREKYKYMTEVKNKGKKKAIVMVSRKLACLMWTMLRTRQVYEERKFNTPRSLAEECLDE
jgi:transposase